MFARSFVVAALMAWSASAEEIFAVEFPIIASLVSSDAGGLTTYAIACPSASEISECNFVQPYTLVQGPSTVSFAITVPGQQTATLGCTMPAESSLFCSATAITPSPSKQTVVATATFSGEGISSYFKSVAIVTDSAQLLTYAPAHTASSNETTDSTSSGSFENITKGVKSGASPKPTGGDQGKKDEKGTPDDASNAGDLVHLNIGIVGGLFALSVAAAFW